MHCQETFRHLPNRSKSWRWVEYHHMLHQKHVKRPVEAIQTTRRPMIKRRKIISRLLHTTYLPGGAVQSSNHTTARATPTVHTISEVVGGSPLATLLSYVRGMMRILACAKRLQLSGHKIFLSPTQATLALLLTIL